MSKTKIISTIGPKSYSSDDLEALIKAGTDVIRFNMSYADYDFCKDVILTLDEINKKYGKFVATMVDLEGSCLRTGKFVGGQATFNQNDKIRIYVTNTLGDLTHFSVNYPGLINDLKYRTIIKMNEGNVQLQVVEKGIDYVVCHVLKGGTVKDNSKIYIPGITLNKKFLTKQDKDDILFAHKMGVDFLSISNVSNSEDVLEVNDLLIELGNNHIVLLAKIENKNAVIDMDNIIKVSDGIILSRNDLAVEIPMEEVPSVKHKVIKKCQEQGKISIISAELTSFMQKAIVPNRTEVSDIANAVIDGVDALMLTAETTIGLHPKEAVNTMQTVIKTAEENINYEYFFDISLKSEVKNITSTISSSVVLGARKLNCKAIIVATNSGYTARKMSRFRPPCPIVAVAQNIKVVKSLSLYFGVLPLKISGDEFDLIIEQSKREVVKSLALKPGDKIIITGGFPFKKIKHTNFMKIEEIKGEDYV